MVLLFEANVIWDGIVLLSLVRKNTIGKSMAFGVGRLCLEVLFITDLLCNWARE